MTTALLLAAAAVAYLLWSRPTAPAGLPPLSPLPAPLVPPGIAGASLEHRGPHPITLLAILAAGAMVAFSILESGKQPTPPAPAPVVGLDLRGRFVGGMEPHPDDPNRVIDRSKYDAELTAAITAELADAIERDGNQTEPRLKTGAAFDDLRRVARELRCRGVSLGARQPAVRDAIKAFLDAQVGTDGGPVDADERAAWVSAFRAVSSAAEAAAR